MKVDATGLQTIALGDSNQVQVGDDVVAIGNALALQGGLSVTRGIISGLHREVDTDSGDALEDIIQTDAAINPGNSGGPLVDSQGRVIGINTAIADPSSAQNVGFAIPISNAKVIIDQLRAGQAARVPRREHRSMSTRPRPTGTTSPSTPGPTSRRSRPARRRRGRGSRPAT